MIQSVECFRPRAYVPPSMFGDVHVVWDSLCLHLVVWTGEGCRGITRGGLRRSHLCPMWSAWRILPSLRDHKGRRWSLAGVMFGDWTIRNHCLPNSVPRPSQRRLPRVHCLVLVEGGTTLSVAGLLSLHTDQATSPANPFCLPDRLVVQFNTDQKILHLLLRKLEKMSLSVK